MGKRESRGEIVIDPSRCKGCGLCVWVCPKGHIVLSEQGDHRGIRVARLHEGHTCTGCSFCAIMCPDVAIRVYRARPPTSITLEA
jgi:2-oxoglutarate ferredoxin oxidoreductase subunit delta